jgi:hypothetical protein
MNRLICLALCASLVSSGCATAPALNSQTGVRTAPIADTHAVMAEFLRTLPIGSRIRASIEDGKRIRGTLMKVTNEAVVILPRARVPEPPLEIPIDRIRSVELERPNGVGRSIAIGAAVGAGAAFAVLMTLIAIYAD